MIGSNDFILDESSLLTLQSYKARRSLSQDMARNRPDW